MPVDYSSSVIVGVEIKRKQLEKEKEVFVGCGVRGHKTDKSLNFCPICGKPVWRTDIKPIKDYNGLDQMFRGLDVCFPSYDETLGSEGTAIVGILLSEHGKYKDNTKPTLVSLKEIDSAIRKVKTQLKNSPFGKLPEPELWHVFEFSV